MEDQNETTYHFLQVLVVVIHLLLLMYDLQGLSSGVEIWHQTLHLSCVVTAWNHWKRQLKEGSSLVAMGFVLLV